MNDKALNLLSVLWTSGSVRRRVGGRIVAGSLLLLAVAVAGCAGRSWKGFPKETLPEFVWPPAPEPARVAYVQSIRSHEDLFTMGGLFSGLVRIVAGSTDTSMLRPYAVAVHPDGLLVADPGLNRVHFYNWKDRKYVAIGADSEGGLPSPVGVAVLPDGDILVSDSRLGEVVRFDPEGDRRGAFAGPEQEIGRPAGLAVDATRGEVYVADVTRHRIAVFDLEGNLLRTVGERGGGSGQLNFPTHLTLAPGGGLAVADSMNFRIALFDEDGGFVRSFGELGSAPGQFSKPKGVAMTADGTVIAVEGLFDSIEFFDSQGRLLLNVGGSGSEPGQFWLPGGVAYDPQDYLLFVADSFNSRVQVFRLLTEAAPGLLITPSGTGEKGRSEAP